MTPEEKAKDLYDKMKGFRITNAHRKKCAIVAATELRQNSIVNSMISYWDCVIEVLKTYK